MVCGNGGPERVRLFLWKVARKLLMVNTERTKRHLTPNPLCPVCGDTEEYLFHCFRYCNLRSQIWRNILGSKSNPSFFSERFWESWLQNNIIDYRAPILNWSLTFGSTLCLMWQARNDLVFSNSEIDPAFVYWRMQRQVQAVLNAKKRDDEMSLGSDTNNMANSVFHFFGLLLLGHLFLSAVMNLLQTAASRQHGWLRWCG